MFSYVQYKIKGSICRIIAACEGNRALSGRERERERKGPGGKASQYDRDKILRGISEGERKRATERAGSECEKSIRKGGR